MARELAAPPGWGGSPGARTASAAVPGVLLALTLFALAVSTYYVVRAWGLWAEGDSAILTFTIRATEARGDIFPPPGETITYTTGYAYPGLSAVLLQFTGLSAPTLQQVVYPLLSALLVFPAWAFYREVTGSLRATALATLFLFLQPEFLFVIFRGSHERLSRAFLLIACLLLVKSFRAGNQAINFGVYVGLFYLVSFGLIATNVLFGFSLMLAAATTAAAAWLLSAWRPNIGGLGRLVSARLASITLAVAALAFIFIFYLYTPSSNSLFAVREAARTVSSMLFDTQSQTEVYNPYEVVALGWVSVQVYFLLSLGTYLLIALTVPIWLWQGWRWLSGAERPATGLWLLWLLCGAFALQVATGVYVDRSGVLGGNLQLRTFPSFALLAAPLLGATVSRWRLPRWSQAAAVGIIAALGAAAVLKATLEPGLSNRWMSYTAAEMVSLEWADRHHQSSLIWAGLDGRLSTAYLMVVGRSTGNNAWEVGIPQPGVRSFLISDMITLLSARSGFALPPVIGSNRIYDNGSAQFYRLRPITPYQR